MLGGLQKGNSPQQGSGPTRDPTTTATSCPRPSSQELHHQTRGRNLGCRIGHSDRPHASLNAPPMCSLDDRALEVPAAAPGADAAQAERVAAVWEDPKEPLLRQRLLGHPLHADAAHHGLAARPQRRGRERGCRSPLLHGDLRAEQRSVAAPAPSLPQLVGPTRGDGGSPATGDPLPSPPLSAQPTLPSPPLPLWGWGSLGPVPALVGGSLQAGELLGKHIPTPHQRARPAACRERAQQFRSPP